MTDLEMQFQGADLDKTDEVETKGASPDDDLSARLDRLCELVEAAVMQVGELSEIVAVSVGRDEAIPTKGEALQQMGLVIEMVREAAERTPRETKAAAAAALGPEVQRLAETIDMRLQGLGNAVRAIDQSRISIEQHVLEIRRKHQADLAIRENWALIALFAGMALSVINLLTFALFWFSGS